MGSSDPSDPFMAEQVSVGYVYVPVVVRSSKGYVRNLKRDHFRLFVDGRPTSFDSFETGLTAPTSLVVLQDLSGSMANGGKLEASRGALRYVLDQAGLGDEFALAWFAGDVFEIEVPFTMDPAPLREAIAGFKAYGTTALQDAIAWLPRIASERKDVKRAALLITDGVDNASTLGATEAQRLVREAELPVYVLALDSRRVLPDEDDEDDDGDKAQSFADTLKELAAQTGGHYFRLSAPEELEGACAQMLDDLHHQYVLGFAVGGPRPERVHRLEVEIAGRGRRALAFRRGYFGREPDAGTAPATPR